MRNHVSYTKFHGEFVVKMIFWLISIMSLVGCTENKTDDTSVDTDSGVVANGSATVPVHAIKLPVIRRQP